MKSPVHNSSEPAKSISDENGRRSRGREVSSRYMLPTASSLAASSFNTVSDGFSGPLRRSASPNSASFRRQKNGSGDSARSVSAERRRPAKAAAEEPEPDAARRPMRGLWPSAANNTPSLADQLGSEKLKRIAGAKIERRPAQENAKPLADEHRPRDQKKNAGNSLSKSTESLSILRAGKSLGRAASSLNLRPRSKPAGSGDSEYLERLQAIVPARLSVDGLEVKPRDLDSASCEDRSLGLGSDDGTGCPASKRTPTRGGFVPARFLQNTLSSLRRLSDTNLRQNLLKAGGPAAAEKRIPSAVAVSANGSESSPGRAPVPSQSPRGLQPTPAKVRAGSPSANAVGRMGSVLNFGMEIFRGRKSAAVQEETTYQLRLLHNRWLQWRFVNARARAAHEAQIVMAEEALFHVWLKASQLRTSVVAKRMQLQKARHELKLRTVLAAHAVQLEDWAMMERDHASAIIGTMECLEAAILKLPLVGGAKADVRTVMQVLGFAADVTNGIRAAATKILPQAQNVNSLLMELVETVAEERALLQECMELLAGVAALQMEENSLRIQLIQLQQSNKQDLHNQKGLKLKQLVRLEPKYHDVVSIGSKPSQVLSWI